MGHGDLVELDGESHGVPPGPPEDAFSGPRISVNLFYYLQSDLERGPVSVNWNGDGAFAPIPDGPGSCFKEEPQAWTCVAKLREQIGDKWTSLAWSA